MNAIQPSRPPLQPIEKRRVISRPKRHLRQRSYQVMGLESTAKIAVNLVITAVAASAFAQLLSYQWLQQEKLREISTDVKLMEGHVNALQTEFSRNFDPQQTKTIMQQQGYRFDPSQRRVVLINQDRREDEQTESSP
ncbi:slr1601 family putative cell division protein [Nostoc sp.]